MEGDEEASRLLIVSRSSSQQSCQRSRKGARAYQKAVEALDALRYTFAPVKLFDVKKLKGIEDTFRIRVGDWRIIYELRRKEATIVVLDIAQRGRAY